MSSGMGKEKKNLDDDCKLTLLYASNLVLVDQDYEATRIIDEYGFILNKEQLLEANLHKLMAIIMIKEKNIIDAYKHNNYARELFKNLHSTLGITLCDFLEAVLIQTEVLMDDFSQESDYHHAQQKFQQAR